MVPLFILGKRGLFLLLENSCFLMIYEFLLFFTIKIPRGASFVPAHHHLPRMGTFLRLSSLFPHSFSISFQLPGGKCYNPKNFSSVPVFPYLGWDIEMISKVSIKFWKSDMAIMHSKQKQYYQNINKSCC